MSWGTRVRYKPAMEYELHERLCTASHGALFSVV
jgi:hypothetical protein